MKSKRLNLFYWLLILVFAIIYIFALFAVFTDEISYEYNLYFRERVTAYWAGDNTMTIGVDTVMNFDYSASEVEYRSALVTDLDLQFVGRGTTTCVVDEKLIYLTGDISLFWRWDDSVESSLTFEINFEFVSEVEIEVEINGKTINLAKGETSITGLNYSRENVLKLTYKSADGSELKLTKVYFSKI